MKLLLTSAGIRNDTIREALVDLLDKPIAECTALAVPTAGYALGGAELAWAFVSGKNPRCPMTELGWKSVGVLELTALDSLGAEHWVPVVRSADVLLVNGGDALYLAHWMRRSGLADLLPTLEETVWVGLSAGSMVMAPSIGKDFADSYTWKPPSGGDETLGVVGFAICPHLVQEGQRGNSMAEAEAWAATMSVPAYAIDDETAIKVVDDDVEVVSEGRWRHFAPVS